MIQLTKMKLEDRLNSELRIRSCTLICWFILRDRHNYINIATKCLQGNLFLAQSLQLQLGAENEIELTVLWEELFTLKMPISMSMTLICETASTLPILLRKLSEQERLSEERSCGGCNRLAIVDKSISIEKLLCGLLYLWSNSVLQTVVIQ